MLKKDYQPHYESGLALAANQKWHEAIAQYREAIACDPQVAKVYRHLGDALNKVEQWNDAISAYQKTISLNPKAVWAHHNLGLALLKLQLPEEAITFFQQALEISPDLVSAHYYLGLSWKSLGKWERALNAFRKTIKLEANFRDTTLLLADTLHQRSQTDLNLAVATYHKLLNNPSAEVDYASVNYKIATILQQKQQLDQALFYLQQAIDLDPKCQDYLNTYAEISRHKSKLYEPLTTREIADRSYSLWSQKNQLTLNNFKSFCLQTVDLEYRPTVGIILPLTKVEDWVAETISTIQNQVYPHWRLYIVTATKTQDGQAYWLDQDLHSQIQAYSQADYRITHIVGDANLAEAELANLARVKIAEEWTAILAPHTFLTPNALFEFACYLQGQATNPVDIIYGDEDKIDRNNLLSEPWFKPQWCPELLRSRNYFGSVVFARTKFIKQQSFSSTCGSAYRYDFYLKLSEQTQYIQRIPRILAHCQHQIVSETDTSKAVIAALKRSGEAGTVNSNLDFPEIKTIRYQIKHQKLVSIIIPTRNLGKILDQCLSSIFELTSYKNYEVLLVDNGSDESVTKEIIQKWQTRESKKFRVLTLDIPFNYSRLNNQAVAATTGEYLLFLNNDTKVISPDWLEAMVEQAQRPHIGAVGALLLYPDETVQHAGVILGVNGVAGHGHRNHPVSGSGYKQALVTTTNYSAVTAACMMCRREVFEQVGGLNEKLAVAYNDVDFCLKLQQQGYYNVWLPHVRLYHFESQTRTPEDTPEKQKRIQQEVTYMEQTWGTIVKNDPCYHPNLTRDKEDFGLSLQNQVEVKAITLAEVTSTELKSFFIDEPKLGHIAQKSLEVVGWVLGNKTQTTAVEINHQGKVIAQTPVDQKRPDVARVYPQISQATNCGFSTTLKLDQLPRQAELVLYTCLTNNTKVELGRIQLS